MISPSDFVNLKYSNDLTQAGIDYLCQVLPYEQLHSGKIKIDEIREIVCESAIELAFRRYINLHQIPHAIYVEKLYTNPLRSEIAIGGRRCKLISKTLTQKRQIRNIRKSPEALMKEPATIREEVFSSDFITDNDILIFCYLNALITPNYQSIGSVSSANLPIFLVHTMPQKWSNPNKWARFEDLSIEGRTKREQYLGLTGLDDQRQILIEDITLSSNSQYSIQKNFFTLSFIHTNTLPENQITLRNQTLGEYRSINPKNWMNIWIYGLEIIIAGYITLGEFRNVAEDSTIFSRIIDPRNSQIETCSIPIGKMHSIEELISRVKTWKP